jgi:hypothetical protein
MFAKLFAIVVGLGLAGGSLLVNRQQRIDVAMEVARTGSRIRAEEAAIGLLQAEIARRVRPDRVAASLDALSQRSGIESWSAVPDRFGLHGPASEPTRVRGGLAAEPLR